MSEGIDMVGIERFLRAVRARDAVATRLATLITSEIVLETADPDALEGAGKLMVALCGPVTRERTELIAMVRRALRWR